MGQGLGGAMACQEARPRVPLRRGQPPPAPGDVPVGEGPRPAKRTFPRTPHPPFGHPLPERGRGVKFNVYFPLAPTGRGARGEGASPALSVSDFFTAPPSKGESLT